MSATFDSINSCTFVNAEIIPSRFYKHDCIFFIDNHKVRFVTFLYNFIWNMNIYQIRYERNVYARAEASRNGTNCGNAATLIWLHVSIISCFRNLDVTPCWIHGGICGQTSVSGLILQDLRPPDQICFCTSDPAGQCWPRQLLRRLP